ncbi:endonuclease SmrB [Shewanella gelidii]|uniref:Ribosome rescue factor SmrB n=1 Tax=Shewanella gelidii TaxID=1642821 RepID=A0A917NAM8_9GAMM|nr:endonuclease SmrB [Shewanella gelidii]MCL1098229.1 endonuclease SmrB [Shewanella gelidii]GGI83570.1 UPF0115 protein [Shewanella gelidii]
MNNPKNKQTMDDFSATFADIKPLKQDKHQFRQPVQKKRAAAPASKQVHAEVYFSDTYQPLLPEEGPMRWVRNHEENAHLKRLKRGDYTPDLLLDLHGLRQSEAKSELSALLHACVKQNIHCCCVMHGLGSGTLKQQVPRWLAQHPQVIAFHQAPKEWGGHSSLLVLMDLGELEYKR